MGFMGFMNFDEMMTPTLVTIIWGVSVMMSLVISLISVLSIPFSRSFAGLMIPIILGFMLLTLRIYLEFLVVIFKINDKLE